MHRMKDSLQQQYRSDHVADYQDHHVEEDLNSGENGHSIPTIFIAIASYRDVDAKDTVRSIYSKARHPERVFLGLVCQRDYTIEVPANEECIPEEYLECDGQGFCPLSNIILKEMQHKEAKGPTYARHLASKMYTSEDYFMMIDSHNLFVKHWDEIIIKEHHACSKISEKCVLSVYPMGLDRPLKQPLEHRSQVAYLCSNSNWDEGGFPGPFRGGVYAAVSEPRPQPYVGSGLIFGPGRMITDVPLDPHLPFLFHGEEILLTTRLWTSGYDFFSPGNNVLFHHYYRPGRPRMETASVAWYAMQSHSTKRVQYILGLKNPANESQPLVDFATLPYQVTDEVATYGMGTVRSLKRYWAFSRIDINKRDHTEANDYWCDKYRGAPPYSTEWKIAAGYKPDGSSSDGE